jgi:hypothetical protein
MPSRLQKATWTSSDPEPRASLATLAERLSECTLDRTSSARELVLETTAVLRTWVHERPLGWPSAEATRELDQGLADWARDHRWRGTAARWLATLEAACALARGPEGPREVLSEELGLWLENEPGETSWSGAPLDPGPRLADRVATATYAVHRDGSGRGLARGETVLVLGGTETVALALERAHGEGLEPRALTGQGGPCADGLRLARRLRDTGVAVTVTWDAALVSRVDEVDRIWLGTEAADETRFLAPVGSEPLLRRARELGVPAELLLETDQRMPRGMPLCTPDWCERDDWLLWDGAPSGVELNAEAYVAVPLALVRVLTHTHLAHPLPASDRTPIQA